MPIIKSAKKKLRQDVKREKHNRSIKETYKKAIKSAKAIPNRETVKKAVSLVAKAAKKGIIHKNNAARKKSRLSYTFNQSLTG